MTIKSIIDEALSPEEIQKNLLQLNNGIMEFSKKINTNPALAQSLGKDILGLGKASSSIQQQIQELNKQRQIEAQKKQQIEIQQQQKQQQQQLQAKKPIMANGLRKLNTGKNIIPAEANNAN